MQKITHAQAEAADFALEVADQVGRVVEAFAEGENGPAIRRGWRAFEPTVLANHLWLSKCVFNISS